MILRWRSGISAVLSLTCLGLGLWLPDSVLAAPTMPGNNAISIEPSSTNITLSPGESSTTITTRITNETSTPLHVGLSARDFSASQVQAGAIQFYGVGYNPNTNPHALQTSIDFPAPYIQLAPKETQKVTVSLNNLSKLAAGGHYGAILFSPQAGVGPATTNVSINSSVASLVFLSTASGGVQSLNLASFPVGMARLSLPKNTYLAFRNSGNTQTAPQGQLTLYSPNGSIVSTTVLNPGEGLVLPGTARLFTVQLTLRNLRFARPGIYRLELEYRSQTGTSFSVVNKRFLYINPTIVIPVIAALILIIALLRRYGSDMGDAILSTFKRFKRIFKKKQPVPEPPVEKPKKPRRLIQG